MSKKVVFIIGLLIGAYVAPTVGFAVFDWKFDSKAQLMAAQAAEAAVQEILVPVCLAQFRADPRAEANLAAFRAEQYAHPRTEFIADGGWATLPGESSPVTGLARKCAEALDKAV